MKMQVFEIYYKTQLNYSKQSRLTIDCGLPQNISNGQYILVGATGYSSIALYTCNAGYKLDKPNNIKRCEVDETWQGAIGTCVRVGMLSDSMLHHYCIIYSYIFRLQYISF